MKKTSLLMLAAALCAPAYGCAHEEGNGGRSTTTQSTQSSGAQNSRASRNTQTSSQSAADEGGERADTRARENHGDPQTPAEDSNRAAETRAESDVTTGGAAATSSGIVERSEEGANNPPPTAQDQRGPGNDAEITLAIRQALVADDSLGVRARNTTIVTRQGVVTLRGTVQDDAERNAIERHARATSGVARVENRIAVRP